MTVIDTCIVEAAAVKLWRHRATSAGWYELSRQLHAISLVCRDEAEYVAKWLAEIALVRYYTTSLDERTRADGKEED